MTYIQNSQDIYVIFEGGRHIAGGLPAKCNCDCDRIYTDSMRGCGAASASMVAARDPSDLEAMAPYPAFDEVCADQHPLKVPCP
jgi:hypothetical protein